MHIIPASATRFASDAELEEFGAVSLEHECARVYTDEADAVLPHTV